MNSGELATTETGSYVGTGVFGEDNPTTVYWHLKNTPTICFIFAGVTPSNITGVGIIDIVNKTFMLPWLSPNNPPWFYGWNGHMPNSNLIVGENYISYWDSVAEYYQLNYNGHIYPYMFVL